MDYGLQGFALGFLQRAREDSGFTHQPEDFFKGIVDWYNGVSPSFEVDDMTEAQEAWFCGFTYARTDPCEHIWRGVSICHRCGRNGQ